MATRTRASKTKTAATQFAEPIDVAPINVVIGPTEFSVDGKTCTEAEFIQSLLPADNSRVLFSFGPEDDKKTITVKEVTCLIVASVQGFVTMSVCIALLSTFLWFWLAIVIAFLASLWVGNRFNGWFARDGYDMCTGTVSKLGSMFRRAPQGAAA